MGFLQINVFHIAKLIFQVVDEGFHTFKPIFFNQVGALVSFFSPALVHLLQQLSRQLNFIIIPQQYQASIYNQRSMITPLCKITFCLDDDSQSEPQPGLNALTMHCIEVFPGSNTHELASRMGQRLGCGYHEAIQNQIRAQLIKILRDGTGSNRSISQEQIWKSEMEKVLGLTDQSSLSISPICSQQRFKSKYFQINYDKFFKTKSEKNIAVHNKQNHGNIYERSVAKKKQTEQKLSMIKKNKLKEEVVQCTFSPNIGNTLEFFSKKNPKFFNPEGKEDGRKSTFERLYKNSFDIQEKRNKRLRTLENEEQTKMSEMSFIPVINECSRQICKMKSYASFLSDLSDTQEKQQKEKIVQRKVKNEHTVKKSKGKQCTFQPQISQNTKKLTKNLPGFYERLQLSKEKKNSNQNARTQTSTKVNKIKLKKEFYTIDDGSPETDELETQKKVKGNKFPIEECQKTQQKQIESKGREENLNEIQKRSHELFNNRKKTILSVIASYLLIIPCIRPDQFSKNQAKYLKKIGEDQEINIQGIEENPHIPDVVKETLEPITSELKEAGMSLNRQQFLWALEKLFDELTLADKGSLLGWGVKLLPQQK